MPCEADVLIAQVGGRLCVWRVRAGQIERLSPPEQQLVRLRRRPTDRPGVLAPDVRVPDDRRTRSRSLTPVGRVPYVGCGQGCLRSSIARWRSTAAATSSAAWSPRQARRLSRSVNQCLHCKLMWAISVSRHGRLLTFVARAPEDECRWTKRSTGARPVLSSRLTSRHCLPRSSPIRTFASGAPSRSRQDTTPGPTIREHHRRSRRRAGVMALPHDGAW